MRFFFKPVFLFFFSLTFLCGWVVILFYYKVVGRLIEFLLIFLYRRTCPREGKVQIHLRRPGPHLHRVGRLNQTFISILKKQTYKNKYQKYYLFSPINDYVESQHKTTPSLKKKKQKQTKTTIIYTQKILYLTSIYNYLYYYIIKINIL